MKAFSFRLSLRERNGAIRTPIAASKGSATGRAFERQDAKEAKPTQLVCILAGA